MRQIQRKKTSSKSDQFTESVIREMTRVALQHGAVNLAQGFPDFPCPPTLKQAAYQAIADDINQYAITWGEPPKGGASLTPISARDRRESLLVSGFRHRSRAANYRYLWFHRSNGCNHACHDRSR